MIYETFLDDDSFEAVCYYAKNVRSLIGLNLKGRPKIISSLLFEANIKNKHKGPLMDNMIYKFNDLGNIIEYTDKYQTALYTYDNVGNLIGLKLYNCNGKLRHNINFITKNGLLTDFIDNDENGIQIARYSFVFDENYNLTESLVFDGSNNKLYAKYVYTYNSNNFCIKRKVFFSENKENNFTRIFQYDEFWNIISTVTYSAVEIPYTIDYKYFDYDSVGNWQTRYRLDYDDYIVERKLIY
jgi:hypothetical protein